MRRPFSWMPPALLSAASALFFASCAADSQPPAAEPHVVPPTPVAASVVVPAPAPVKSEDEDEVTGKSLYQRHCAGCHNDNGDGRGATILAQGKQARSFAQGGFAFGNTPEAIFKTITSGIPGSSLMQPFKSQMDDDERMLVAKYVLTLTPYGESGLAAGSILAVDDRAIFAYGKLPPLHDGLPERPRGLMVGLPGGASFEYRVDDVRLLAMRRGGFVDRTDWNERGGGYLKPLGDLVFEADSGDALAGLMAHVDNAWTQVALDLTATRCSGAKGREAELEMKPKSSSSFGIRRVVETLYQPQLSEPESFGRRIRIERTASPADMQLGLVNWGGLPAPVPVREKRAADNWVVLRRAEDFDCIHVEFAKGSGVSLQGNGQFVGVSWGKSSGSAPAPIDVRVVVVRVKDWDEALLTRLSKELAR